MPISTQPCVCVGGGERRLHSGVTAVPLARALLQGTRGGGGGGVCVCVCARARVLGVAVGGGGEGCAALNRRLARARVVADREGGGMQGNTFLRQQVILTRVAHKSVGDLNVHCAPLNQGDRSS